jgi:hypothetical protein
MTPISELNQFHEEGLRALTVAPGGNIWTSSIDGTICIWRYTQLPQDVTDSTFKSRAVQWKGGVVGPQQPQQQQQYPLLSVFDVDKTTRNVLTESDNSRRKERKGHFRSVSADQNILHAIKREEVEGSEGERDSKGGKNSLDSSLPLPSPRQTVTITPAKSTESFIELPPASSSSLVEEHDPISTPPTPPSSSSAETLESDSGSSSASNATVTDSAALAQSPPAEEFVPPPMTVEPKTEGPEVPAIVPSAVETTEPPSSPLSDSSADTNSNSNSSSNSSGSDSGSSSSSNSGPNQTKKSVLPTRQRGNFLLGLQRRSAVPAEAVQLVEPLSSSSAIPISAAVPQPAAPSADTDSSSSSSSSSSSELNETNPVDYDV